jgi:hypothetical protein
MNQYNQPSSSKPKETVVEAKAELRQIDALAKELIVDGTRVVLVNVDYVAALEKRIKALEVQVSNLKETRNYLMQKVKSIK